MNKIALTLALVASGLISHQAGAAVNWSIGTITGDNTNPSYGNSRTYGSGTLSDSTTVGVTVTAFSATGGTSTTSQADASSRNTRTLETAYLSIYTPNNGLGVVNRDGTTSTSPAVSSSTTASDSGEYINGGNEHSMDNNGRSDVMLLTFTDQIALQSLKLGWIGSDSDVFVLAWSGTGTPASLAGKTFESIAADSANDPANGWRLVSNLSNVGLNTTTSFNTATPISSSYWLIGTGGFNSAATGGGVTSGEKSGDNWIAFGSTGANYDYAKLAAVGGTKAEPPGNNIPEPGTLGLAGAALFALTALRRRKSVA